MKRFAPLLIITAGVLWGLMGIFVRSLGGFGFSSIQTAAVRLITGALLLFAITAVYDRRKLRISRRDIPWFLGMGIASILMFTVCYFKTITISSLSTAAILLYTAPIMVMLMSVVLFHEKLTLQKTAALVLTFTGCALVSGAGGGMQVTPAALGCGLLSGFGYGLYSILGTYTLKKYEPITVTSYTFLFAGLGAVFICRPAEMIQKITDGENRAGLLLLILLTAFVTVVLPYLFYTTGLFYVKASSASIMASAEPVVATAAGFLVFHEKLSMPALAGIVLVIGAITLLNLPAGNVGQRVHTKEKEMHGTCQ